VNGFNWASFISLFWQDHSVQIKNRLIVILTSSVSYGSSQSGAVEYIYLRIQMQNLNVRELLRDVIEERGMPSKFARVCMSRKTARRSVAGLLFLAANSRKLSLAGLKGQFDPLV